VYHLKVLYILSNNCFEKCPQNIRADFEKANEIVPLPSDEKQPNQSLEEYRDSHSTQQSTKEFVQQIK
jgi:hypothetical protein